MTDSNIVNDSKLFLLTLLDPCNNHQIFNFINFLLSIKRVTAVMVINEMKQKKRNILQPFAEVKQTQINKVAMTDVNNTDAIGNQ